MWTWVTFINFLGLCSAVSSGLPRPSNVSFSSVNLRNVLQWFPGNGTPDGTHFTVEYAIYGDSIVGSKGKRAHWRAVWKCTDIIRTWCDLTTETWDLEHGYHARVRATHMRSSSKWTATQRFDPKSDTTFGPPLVSLEIENNSVIITLMGPMRYSPNNYIPELSMVAVYPHMGYNLSIHNIHRKQMHHFPVAAGPYKYHLLDFNTEYCFSAKSTFISLPVRCQASTWQCVTTPQDPMIEQLQKVVVGIVVPSLCICIIMVVGYLLYNYLTGKGQKSPITLKPPSFHSLPLKIYSDNPSFLLPVMRIDKPPFRQPCPEPGQCIAPPLDSYSPQGAETPPQPEEDGDDSSVDYGSVFVVTPGNREAREIQHDEGDCGNSRMGEDQKNGDGGKKDDPIYAPQAKLCLSQSDPYSLRQTHMPINKQREVRSLVQTHLKLQIKSATEQEEIAGMRDGGKKEISQGENAPLLSPFVSQNIKKMPICHHGQPDRLSHDDSLLEPAAVKKTEDHVADEEDEEGTIRINWNPESRKLVLPEIGMWFKKETTLGGLTPSESRRENRVTEKGEDRYVSRVQPLFDSVIVRQSSEDEAESQRALERGGDAVWDVDDVLTEWGLVISNNE